MNLAPAVAAVVAALTPRFPALKVAAHGGTFSERELALWIGSVPCLRIACLGLSVIQPRGRDGWQADLSWTAYLLASDQPGHPRAALALDTIDTLLAYLITGPGWGLACQPPQLDTIHAENLYTGPVNVLSVALWAVSWTQTHYFEG